MHSVINYEKILKANARQKVALEVLSFHASSSPEEAERVMVRCVLLFQCLQNAPETASSKLGCVRYTFYCGMKMEGT